MKIVIFDDDMDDMSSLEKIIEQWIINEGLHDIILFKYYKISNLIFSLPEIISSDLFFLDIVTPDGANSGFRLAERIHGLNPNTNIVFTSNTSVFCCDAFEISALHYLVKPVDEKKVKKLLNYVYHSPSKRRTSFASLPGLGENEFLDFDKILFLEAKTAYHLALIHLTDGTEKEITLSAVSFSSLLNNILSDDFSQCHRGFIVNMNYIQSYTLHTVTIQHCKEALPIGKKYRLPFLNKLIEHKKGTGIQ